MSDATPVTTALPDKDERSWATAAHLCGLLWLLGGGSLIFFPFGTLVLFTVLGPLIIWKAKGDVLPFAGGQAKEALNFQITMLLLGLASCLLLVVGIGFVLLWILGLLNLIFVIIAAIQVNDGKPYRYPFAIRLVS
ncbi:MAG: DUF4870 domain-containing protein [Proteobacteria bacterium]|nr:DUF4870 domain-containing protein [Pseudomonadota bacterium]